MKALLLTVLLSFSGSSAYAEWVKVSSDDTSMFYVDRNEIEVNGHIRKFWSNENSFNPEKNATLSTQALYETNCLHDTTNLLSITYFDQAFGKGKTISTRNLKGNESWTPIRPGSPIAAMQKFVCNQ